VILQFLNTDNGPVANGSSFAIFSVRFIRCAAHERQRSSLAEPDACIEAIGYDARLEPFRSLPENGGGGMLQRGDADGSGRLSRNPLREASSRSMLPSVRRLPQSCGNHDKHISRIIE